MTEEPPLTPIQRSYLEGFDAYLGAETLGERRRGESVMNGTLPFLLAEKKHEDVLRARVERARLREVRGQPELEPLDRLIVDL